MFLPIIAILAFVVLFVFYLYNDLVTLRMRVKEAWSEIDVQLKRRSDLIPNLVESVKGYVKHEKSVLENVTRARSALLMANGPSKKAFANDQLGGALKSLFAVAESYPQLRASENFLQLQQELSDTEDKVAYARQFYNTSVLDYNTKLQVFPSVFIANHFHFTPEEFFESSEEDKKKVSVSFS